MFNRSFRSSAAVLAGILITIGGCSESPAGSGMQFVVREGGARFDAGGTASVVITPAGGTIQTGAGDRIIFPEGAVAEPTTVTMTSSTQYTAVELEPHGLRFPAGHEPVLQLNISGSNARDFRSLNIVYVDEAGVVAEILPTVVGGNRTETNLRHFSGYMNAGH
ncbi:MAG: hypothetical protein ACJ8GN_22455 [Longimicrobiaceae bacterium]